LSLFSFRASPLPDSFLLHVDAHFLAVLDIRANRSDIVYLSQVGSHLDAVLILEALRDAVGVCVRRYRKQNRGEYDQAGAEHDSRYPKQYQEARNRLHFNPEPRFPAYEYDSGSVLC
jgi:hypothetical protein